MTTRSFKVLKMFFVALLALPVLSVAVLHSPADAEPPNRVEYVVMLQPGAGAAAARLGRQYGASHVYSAVFPGFAAVMDPRAAAALERNPNVQLIEPALTVHKTGDYVPAGISRIEATVAHAQAAHGAGANVAIVDSGVQLNHPDLSANINTALSRSFISRGKNMPNGDDDNGHGTHVAGTVAAAINGIGVVGVAPGATLISLKVLNHQGSGSTADIIAAMDFITAHNNATTSYADVIHVANCSFGGTGSSSTFKAAFDKCQASGCLVVAAAGNSSRDASGFIPASYASTFTVSAMNPLTDNFASFSNYGAVIDMAAPGVSTYSTYIGGGYTSMSGTSMAAPHVAGTAAIFVGQNLSTLTRTSAESDIRTALLAAGEEIELPGDRDDINEPLVNAAGVAGPASPPPEAVHVSITLDQPAYSTSDTQAVLTVTVTDETSTAITGLLSTHFVATGAPTLAFSETGGGAYEVTVDISGFTADVDYPVTVTVTDNRLIVGDDTVTIRRDSPPPPPPPSTGTIYVSDISYSEQGPHLTVEITIGSVEPNLDVSGVSVSITLSRNGSSVESATGLTDAEGKFVFRYRRAPNGTYTTDINDVSKSGLTYDSGLDATDPEYTK